MIALCGSSFSGNVGLPTENIALPDVGNGTYLICIWDDNSGTWLRGFEQYTRTGEYEFQVPEWGKWYWVGLWDEAKGDYIFGKWIGHFLSE